MRPRVDVTDIVLAGKESLPPLQRHLERLRNLPAHGNRKLHLDQLFIALLLSFYNVIVDSLRLIEDCGDMNGRLDIDRLCKSTTAEALKVFDPEHLVPIIEDLKTRIPTLRHTNQDLHLITQRIIAADGTYMTTLSNVAWALLHTKSNGRKQGQVRANFQMDTATFTPVIVSVSGDDGSEPAAFAKDLLSDVCYVMDRNFLDFSFLDQLLAKNNHFVLRARSNAPAMTVADEIPLTVKDREAGVVQDAIVTLDGRGAPPGRFRLVVIERLDRNNKPETIRLLTSLTDTAIEAHVIGAIYEQRWQIELFFKWLKVWAGMNHLMSTSRNGITFQFYVAVIGVLLMYMQLGRRISRYAIVGLHNYLHGRITLEQLMNVIERREREKELARLRAAKKRAQKKLA